MVDEAGVDQSSRSSPMACKEVPPQGLWFLKGNLCTSWSILQTCSGQGGTVPVGTEP